MKLGYYYGLVFDKTASTYTLLKIQRARLGESTVEAYTRWVKELEQQHKGRYTTMGLSFGALRIEYNIKTQMGIVKVGFSELGMVTAKPSILSTGFKGPGERPMYLSGKPNPIMDNGALCSIRDAIIEHITDAVWAM